MVKIAVPPQLADSPQHIRQNADLLEGIVNVLRGKFESTREFWTSDSPQGAANEYRQYADAWDLAAQSLFGGPKVSPGVLEEIANLMVIVTRNYLLVEEGNAAGWRHT